MNEYFANSKTKARIEENFKFDDALEADLLKELQEFTKAFLDGKKMKPSTVKKVADKESK